MKGEATLKILESIKGSGVSPVKLIDVLINSGYGASYRKMQWNLDNYERFKNKPPTQKEIDRAIKERYNDLIYKLSKDGLIEEKIINKTRVIRRTTKGNGRFIKLRKRFESFIPMPSIKNIKKEISNNYVVVSFDIPEKQRYARNWLRAALKNIGLEMIQQSFWMGKVKIPEDFINDLYQLGIVNFVEIFEINKQGSLKHLT